MVRHDLGFSDAQLVAIGVGRPAPSKRFDLTIDAVASARRSGADVSLLLVGVGADSDLRDQCERLGVADHVRLLDGRFGDELARLIASSDVLVSASDYEGFGLTLIEGMACGLPVIATAAGGVTDIVVDGETGYLVTPGSSAAIAERLQLLASTPEILQRLGESAVDRVRSEFGASLTTEAFHALYRELTT